MRSIKDFSSELRTLFLNLLDVETGDGACALSLLDALEVAEDDKEYIPTTESKRLMQLEEAQPIERPEPNEGDPNTADQVADMFDLVLDMILELNLRTKKLESNAKNNPDD